MQACYIHSFMALIVAFCVHFSGFAFVRPTTGSILLYETARDLYVKFHKAHDQAYINLAIERLNGYSGRKNPVALSRSAVERMNGETPAVVIHSLPYSLFPCGVYYFEHGHRMFGNRPQCRQCVMAHNNYMGSIAAKVTPPRFISSICSLVRPLSRVG